MVEFMEKFMEPLHHESYICLSATTFDDLNINLTSHFPHIDAFTIHIPTLFATVSYCFMSTLCTLLKCLDFRCAVRSYIFVIHAQILVK